MSDKLIDLQDSIAYHLDKIAAMFTQRPKITLVVRTPWLDAEGKDGGVVIGDDDFDLAIAEINKLRAREPVR
jgi:hypothetical protein